MSRNHRNQSKE